MFDFSRFAEACQTSLKMPDPADAVRKIMSDAMTVPTSIESALGTEELNEGDSAKYVFLHQSPALTILKVVMPGNLLSPPHNHLIWAVIGIYKGRENNIFYRREGDRIVETGRRDLVAPEVMMLTPDVIHGISNPIAHQSYALHVYGGSLANPARSLWNPFTLKEEPFQIPALLNYEREMMQRTAGKGP